LEEYRKLRRRKILLNGLAWNIIKRADHRKHLEGWIYFLKIMFLDILVENV